MIINQIYCSLKTVVSGHLRLAPQRQHIKIFPTCEEIALACLGMLTNGGGIVIVWSRQKSNLEELMIEVLKKKETPLTLHEIVEEIRKKNSEVFTGKTPKKSLYSTIYRREKARIKKGNLPVFSQNIARRDTLYSLNTEAK